MTESPKLSRRDWFRLGSPNSNSRLGTESPSTQKNKLQPIEHPPNHDGLDLDDLPAMREALLSPEQVQDLFSDVIKLASDIQLMQRRKKSGCAEASQISMENQLQIVEDSLLTGELERVQIRYRWRQSLWIDTLKRKDGGFYLVRISHQSSD